MIVIVRKIAQKLKKLLLREPFAELRAFNFAGKSDKLKEQKRVFYH